jgi:hypothetical protein
VVFFIPQPLYPDYRLEKRLGWPLRGFVDAIRMRAKFSCPKLMDESFFIQPTALLSCQASSCPTRTEKRHIT